MRVRVRVRVRAGVRARVEHTWGPDWACRLGAACRHGSIHQGQVSGLWARLAIELGLGQGRG